MYYFLLSISIIIIFILNQKYGIYDKLKNLLDSKNFKTKTHKKKEHFGQHTPTPSPTPTPLPSPTPNTRKRPKKNRQVADNLKVLGKFVSKGKEVQLSLDLVYLDPKYHFEKTTYLYGKKNTFENLEWKQEFTKSICQNDRGKCACYKAEDGEEICGVAENDYIYECANPCPECDKCHLRRGKIQLQYQEYCNKAFNQQDKERCEKYKERVLLTKENCFFSENKDPKLIKQKDKCRIFLPARYNSYLVGEDIIFKVNLKYFTPRIRDLVENIKIVDFRIDNEIIHVNEFYNSKDEIYLFFNTEDKHQGLNKIVKINGIIFFKQNKLPKIEFSNENVVNIFTQPELEEGGEDADADEEEAKSREEIINKRLKETLEPNIKKQIIAADEDRFNHNYLGENRYYMCQKFNNYTVYNPIKQLKNGTFTPKKKLDNPNSWKQRGDINRPWDYIIE